jgi:plasmid stability protein
VGVRTTVDLPDDVHTLLRSLARSQGRSFSETVAEILRHAVLPSRAASLRHDEVTGLVTADVGRPITAEEAATYDDDEIDELLADGDLT